MNIQRHIDELTNDLTDILVRFPELADDDDLRADVLEGETDLHAVLERLHEIEVNASIMMDGITQRITDLRERKDRFGHKVDVARALMRKVLNRAELKKVELPEVTISLRGGSDSVHIEDPDAVPSQLCKTVVSPDKTAIKKALQQGEIVPGAVLVTGDETVSIRRK